MITFVEIPIIALKLVIGARKLFCKVEVALLILLESESMREVGH